MLLQTQPTCNTQVAYRFLGKFRNFQRGYLFLHERLHSLSSASVPLFFFNSPRIGQKKCPRPSLPCRSYSTVSILNLYIPSSLSRKLYVRVECVPKRSMPTIVFYRRFLVCCTVCKSSVVLAIERPPKCLNPKKKKAKKSPNEPFFYPELRPKGSIVQEGIRPRDKNGPSEYL